MNKPINKRKNWQKLTWSIVFDDVSPRHAIEIFIRKIRWNEAKSTFVTVSLNRVGSRNKKISQSSIERFHTTKNSFIAEIIQRNEIRFFSNEWLSADKISRGHMEISSSIYIRSDLDLLRFSFFSSRFFYRATYMNIQIRNTSEYFSFRLSFDPIIVVFFSSRWTETNLIDRLLPQWHIDRTLRKKALHSILEEIFLS